MVFSTVIIRISADHVEATPSSNAASGSGFGFTKPGRRTAFASTHGGLSTSNGPGIASHVLHPEGVQITLDTVTHRDPEFEMDKLESGTSSYHKSEVFV